MNEMDGEEVEVEMNLYRVNQKDSPARVKDCPTLLGWRREVVTRQNGRSAGKNDVYYYSPSGIKFRSKQVVQRNLGVDLSFVAWKQFVARQPSNVEGADSDQEEEELLPDQEEQEGCVSDQKEQEGCVSDQEEQEEPFSDEEEQEEPFSDEEEQEEPFSDEEQEECLSDQEEQENSFWDQEEQEYLFWYPEEKEEPFWDQEFLFSFSPCQEEREESFSDQEVKEELISYHKALDPLQRAVSSLTARSFVEYMFCVRKFLSTLTTHMSSGQHDSETTANVNNMVKNLLDGNIEAEDFTSRLHRELNDSEIWLNEVRHLVPRLKMGLPELRKLCPDLSLSAFIQQIYPPPPNPQIQVSPPTPNLNASVPTAMALTPPVTPLTTNTTTVTKAPVSSLTQTPNSKPRRTAVTVTGAVADPSVSAGQLSRLPRSRELSHPSSTSLDAMTGAGRPPCPRGASIVAAPKEAPAKRKTTADIHIPGGPPVKRGKSNPCLPQGWRKKEVTLKRVHYYSPSGKKVTKREILAYALETDETNRTLKEQLEEVNEQLANKEEHLRAKDKELEETKAKKSEQERLFNQQMEHATLELADVKKHFRAKDKELQKTKAKKIKRERLFKQQMERAALEREELNRQLADRKEDLQAKEKELEKTKAKKSQQERRFNEQMEHATLEREELNKQLADRNEDLQAKEKELEETKEQAQHIRAELQCIVCQGLLIEPVMLSCAHSFCTDCIMKWREEKNECPTCRERIQSQPVRNLMLVKCIEPIVQQLSPTEKAERQREITKRAANQEETPDPMVVPPSQDMFSSSQDMLPPPTPQGILDVSASIFSPIAGLNSDSPAYSSPAYSNIPSVSSTASENEEPSRFWRP